MERMNFVAGGLFFVAAVFSIASMVMPEWIVSEIRSSATGPQKFGLLRFCVTIAGRNHFECYSPAASGAWLATFGCILIGCLCCVVTSVLLVISKWRRRIGRSAKWFGLTAMALFCTAAILFPGDFSRVEIGGAPYRLPRNCRIGISYIFFILSLWIVIVSELFAGRFCAARS